MCLRQGLIKNLGTFLTLRMHTHMNLVRFLNVMSLLDALDYRTPSNVDEAPKYTRVGFCKFRDLNKHL